MFWINRFKFCGIVALVASGLMANGCSDDNSDDGTPSASATADCAGIPNNERGQCTHADGIYNNMNCVACCALRASINYQNQATGNFAICRHN